MVQKILVSVDGSDTMEQTIGVACDLAKAFGGSLALIHVVTLPVPIEPMAPIDPTPLEQVGKKILEDARKLAEDKGCRAESILETDVGNAGYRIARVAKEKGFTLIVIHARGHSRAATLLLGSVCHTVVHNASCPVMVLRP